MPYDGGPRFNVQLVGASGGASFPPAAALGDNTANPTTTSVAAMNFWWDGATWDRSPGNSAGGAFVQGPAAAGAAVAGNPLVLGISDGTNIQVVRQSPSGSSIATPGVGIMAVGPTTRASSGSFFHIAAIQSLADADNGVSTQAIAVQSYNGASFDKTRTPNVFKIVQLAAGTAETTIWTPAAGKKFRLLGFLLTCGLAATLTFKDNTAGTTIFVARGAADAPITPSDMGNGFLSGAANRLLTVTRSVSSTLDGVVWGCEE